MQRALLTLGLLVLSNIFMTLAWYGHLKFGGQKSTASLIGIILISWGIALFEYALQIPANRIGFHENGGPFNLWQLKIIQEVISISVFIIFTLTVFKQETFRMNHVIGFLLLIAAVYFFFKK